MVAVGGTATDPVVLCRRQVALVKPGISKQPYHAAAGMDLQDAERFLRHCKGMARTLAQTGVRETKAELAAQGFQPVGCAVLLSSGRPTGELAATLASHPAIHTAEGEFYREALRHGAESCAIPVTGFKERDIAALGAANLGMAEDELQRRIAAFGKAIGPPWRQDEKLATLAAWLVLAALA